MHSSHDRYSLLWCHFYVKLKDTIVKVNTLDEGSAEVGYYHVDGRNVAEPTKLTPYKGISGAFIIYDTTDRQSVEGCHHYFDQVKRLTEKSFPVVVLGTKCDLLPPDNMPTPKQIKAESSRCVGVMSVSALTGEGLERACTLLIGAILRNE